MSNGIAGIWARVSTDIQQSLDSQVARAKAELEKRGYVIPPERILKVDWTSNTVPSFSFFAAGYSEKRYLLWASLTATA